VLEARGGKVRILRREELPPQWDPQADQRAPVWECLQHLIVRLERAGVESAGELLAKIGDERGEQSKLLAVRLYEICDRRRWASDAFAYNQIVREFPDIQKVLEEDAVRYDAYVREFPAIQEAANRQRELEQSRLGI